MFAGLSETFNVFEFKEYIFEDMQKRIILAKVDATVEKILADQYDVSGFPTLKIFRNGKRFDYTGPRDVNGIFFEP